MSNAIITRQQLSSLIPGNKYVEEWCDALNLLLPQYRIDSTKRVAAFLAQCIHESAGFKFLKENLNYRADSLMRTWPSRFPTLAFAQQYARNPQKIANYVYANRMGNGPESSGDGWRHIGRGLIQLTGKNNYQRFANSTGIDINDLPDYLETFEGAVHSACWFWDTNNLNTWVDKDDFDGLSDVINRGRKTEKYGDAIGFADRIKYYQKALKVLGA